MNMPENNKKTAIKSWPVYLFLLLVLASSLWAIRRRRQAQPAAEVFSTWGDEETVSSPLITPGEVEIAADAPEKAVESTKPASKPDSEPSHIHATAPTKIAALEKIINNRQGWDPVGTNWFGKEAADFSFRSIDDGKMRKLSDYRGKDVILIFWATWCPPCQAEIPHLIKLRKEISPDKLEIIAISKENTDLIKQFVKSNSINYTTTSISSRLPAPFSYVESIPTAFYINEAGEIEIIVVGVVSAETAEDILAL